MKTCVLFCLLAIVALASAQRPVRPGDEDRERDQEDGCNIDELPDNIKKLLHELRNGTKTREDLLPYARLIPPVCLRRLLTTPMIRPGSCTVELVKTAVCDVGGEVEKVRGLIMCLNSSQVCQLVTGLLSSDVDCVKNKYIAFYSELIHRHDCQTSTLPSVSLLYLSNDVLRERLDAMSLIPDMFNLLNEFKEESMLNSLTSVPCDKVKILADVVQQKVEGMGTTLNSLIDAQIVKPADILHILPYMSAKMCQGLSATLLTGIGLETLGELPFQCARPEEQSKSLREQLEELREKIASGLSGVDREGVEALLRKMQQNLDGPKCEFPCGRIIIKTLSDADRIDLDNSAIIDSLGNLAKCLPKDSVVETAKPGLCADIDVDLIPRQERDRERLARKCRPSSGNPRNMSETDVRGMGCAVLGLNKRELEEIPVGSLRGALGNIKDCLEEAASDFITKLEERLRRSGLSGEDVRQLGKAAARVSRESLRELSKTDLDNREVVRALVDGLKDMVGKREPGAKARAFDITKKMEELKDIVDSEEMMGSMGRRELEKRLKAQAGGKLDVNATKEFLGLDRVGVDPKPSFSQARLLVQALLGGKMAEEITEADLEELKGKLLNGLGADFIEKLAGNRFKLRLLSMMCRQGDWDGQQVKALYELMKKVFGEINPEAPLAEFSTAHAQAFSSECLLGIGDADLRNMSNSACAEVCAKKHRAEKLMCFLGQEAAKETIRACLECRGKMGTDDKLTEEDVDALGKALQMAPSDVISRIPDDILVRKAKHFRLRCTLKHIRETIRKKVHAAVDNATAEERRAIMERAGAYVLSKLPERLRNQIKDILADKLDDILEDIDTPVDEKAAEENDCCRAKNSDEENEEVDEEEEEVEEQVAEVVDATVTAQTKRRRRASASSYTCADLRSMGSSITMLTIPEITDILQDEFYNCLAVFGSAHGWSEAQGTALLEKVKALASNNICNLAASRLKEMKYISYHLSVEHVRCLTNLNEDVVTALGTLHEWKPELAAEFATKYLGSLNMVSTSDLTDSHLVSLGHFLCGLSVEKIKQINPVQFESAGATLGQVLMTCPVDRLQALAHVARQSGGYGPVSKWDASIYNEIGIVIAGLSDSETSQVTPEAIEGWHIKAIKLIPLENLKMMSSSQLESFSPEQALAIPRERRDMLSVDQQNAINRAQYGDDAPIMDQGGDGKNNGGDPSSGTTLTVGLWLTFSSLVLLHLLSPNPRA